MNKTTYDPITKKEYPIKKQIETKYCTINLIYNVDDLDQQKISEIIGNALYNQAIE